MSFYTCVIGITVVATLISLYKRVFVRGKMCPSHTRMDGKTVIVTGANTGIGKETAKDLAKRGARVILACRDMDKAEEAARHIREVTTNREVIARKLDLASLKSVREFSEQFHEDFSRLDGLINNAGLGNIPYEKTADGLEMTMAVNYVGHFLLTSLLLDLLKQSAPSRIVNVAAHAHYISRLDVHDLFMNRSNYKPIIAYCNSKLANIMHTRELARRFQGTGVTSYCLHPGVIHSEFGRHFELVRSLWTRWVANTFQEQFFKTTVEGAQTTIYCAVAEELEHQSGKYYSQCAESTPTELARNDTNAKELWEVTERLVGNKQD